MADRKWICPYGSSIGEPQRVIENVPMPERMPTISPPIRTPEPMEPIRMPEKVPVRQKVAATPKYYPKKSKKKGDIDFGHIMKLMMIMVMIPVMMGVTLSLAFPVYYDS